MQNVIDIPVAARAALPALADVISHALAATADALRPPVQLSEPDKAEPILRGLGEAEGALVIIGEFTGQTALSALVRLLRAPVSSAQSSMLPFDRSTDALHAAAVCLQQSVNRALKRILCQGEVRAAELLPCWRRLAAVSGQTTASAAELLSLQFSPEHLPPQPSATRSDDLLANAERALLSCLRVDQPLAQAAAVCTFADVIAGAGAGAPDSERVCWLALHAWLLEYAQAGVALSDDDKKILAAVVRALRHRGRAGRAATLEPLARAALYSLSGMSLQTEAGRQVARLFRLDDQLGNNTESCMESGAEGCQEDGAHASPHGAELNPVAESFRSAVAGLIAAIDADAARIGDVNAWNALADDAAYTSGTAALALPLRQLVAQLAAPPDHLHSDGQRELLAAVLIVLSEWAEQGDAEPDRLVSLMAQTCRGDAASVRQALCAYARAHSAYQRLATLCDTLRAELHAAEQTIEAAWQDEDDPQAVTVADTVLRQVGAALLLCGRQAAFDAVAALRARLAEGSSGDDFRDRADAIAADWVRLSADIAVLPWQTDVVPEAPAQEPAHERCDKLAAIFIDEASDYLHSLRQLALLPSGPHDEAVALRAVHTIAGCSATIGLSAMATLALALEDHLRLAGWHTDDVLTTDTLNALQRMLDNFIATGQCGDAPDLLVRLQQTAQIFAADVDDSAARAIVPQTPDTPTACDEAYDFVVVEADSTQAVAMTVDLIEANEIKANEIEADAVDLGVIEVDATEVDTTEVDTIQVDLSNNEAGDLPPSALRHTPVANSPVTGTDPLDELQAIFNEEAADLLPQLELALRAWQQHPDGSEPPRQLLRLLHTLKGSARTAGRQSLGDEFHHAEAEIIALAQQPPDAVLQSLPALQVSVDRWMSWQPPAGSSVVPADRGESASDTSASPRGTDSGSHTPAAAPERQLRVRAGQLARVADQAAALWISNASIGDAVQDQRQAVASLSDDLTRLRVQLRELEIEAESRIVSRATQDGDAGFDPLEFDRYTRLHELTRMMAESIADLAGTQRGLKRQVERLAAAAAAQARDMRRFQQDLQGMRTQPLSAIEPRLRHLLRQAARDAGRDIVLRLEGGEVEIERGLLDRLNGPFGHLLRNAVVHGIEPAEQRIAVGKPATGTVILGATVEGNALQLWLQDDGRGLDLAHVRQRAIAAGLLSADEEPKDDAAEDDTADAGAPGDAALAELIFAPGFSTATEVTALSGRGIGMDAVAAEVQSLGGRIAVHSEPGQGCRFTLSVPIALASVPVLLAVAGTRRVALPAALVRQLVQPAPGDLSNETGTPQLSWQGHTLPVRHLAQVLGEPAATGAQARSPVVVVEQGDRQLALQLDAVHGQREVIVRHPGAQLARVPGIAGATLLGDGGIALVVDPFGLPDTSPEASVPAPEKPCVMVVDDSLTVRRASQRLLERHGYAVTLARDGLEALELLQRPGERRPAVLLLDIEMPRMDGFELLAALRADNSLCALPVVMVTSRIAERHRERARALGVLDYLGKPFDEQALLSLLAGLTGQTRLAA